MKKKILTILFALTASVGITFAETYSGTCGENLTWTLEDSKLTISGTGEMKSYTSNAPWNSHRESIHTITIEDGVKNIGNYAFLSCSKVTSIAIPNSVTTIGDNAFLFCSSLTSITIPSSVTSIGNSAFSNCTSLTSVTIPNSVTSIGEGAFCRCSSLTSITIPNSVTSIGYRAFSGCSSLTAFTIPNSVKSIGQYAFSSCSSLTSVTIPNSVTSIGYLAFSGCSKLNSVYISDITAWCKIIFDTRDSNPLYYAHNLYLNGTLVTDLAIPNSVTSIGNYAFYGCNSLTSINIPNSVTSIGNDAFSECSGLTDIEIPNSVTSIGNSAFSECSNLTSVTIPNSVTSIEDFTFFLCSSLTSITIPNSLTTIGQSAFSGCSSLASVTIPNSVKSIGHIAFSGCSSLPVIDNIRYADTYLVEAVDKTLSTYNIKEGTKWIGTEAFYECSFLISIEIPGSVISIDRDAFYGCSSLPVFDNIRYADTYLVEVVDKTLSTYNIKGGTKWIGSLAFKDCSSMISIYIPNSVTSIGEYAFWNCSSLPYISIPDNVTNIGMGAFLRCSRLFGISLPDGITQISWDCFEGCSSLTSIIIPDGVTAIYEEAFRECTNLESVTIPNSVTELQQLAFYLCSGLKSVTIGNQVPRIRISTFYGCSSLESITIPSSVKEIDEGAFGGCSSLMSVSVEAGNTAYDSRGDCNAVIETSSNKLVVGCQNTIIPSSVTVIGSSAFSGHSGLTSVDIPNNVTSIGEYAFSSCTGLTSITCEAINPPILGNDVFYNVDKSIPLYVPAESVDDYKAADQWKDFNVQAIKNCTIETTDGITVWEDELPYTWEDKIFTEAGTQTTTLKSMDGCDSIVTFTLRVLYRNITLQENESSDYYTQFAQDYNGQRVNTATLNRQFTQGKWATLCLPFNVNKALMTALGLYNRVFAFRYAQQLDDETIQVFFVPAQSIEAGKGYIVNPNAKLAAKTSFVFPNVTINTDSDNGDITALTGYNDGTNRGNLFLVGTLRTGMLQGSTTGNTYLGLKDNQLYYPNMTTGTSIRAYRAVFRSDVPVNASRVRIVAEGESVSELEVTVDEQGRMDNGQLQNNATPARKYIDNGILYIERNGITYTAQGHRLD